MYPQPRLEGFLADQWKIISSFWGKVGTDAMAEFDKKKAQLQAAIGSFLQLRLKLINMGDAINALQKKAAATANPQLREAATSLEEQRQALLADQGSLESKVQLIAGKMAAVEAGQAPPGGLGQDPIITPTVILAVAGAAAVVAGLVVIHTQKVTALDKLLKDVENKTLTPAEAAALQRGTSLLPSFGSITPYLIGAAVLVGGYFYFTRRR
jgi:hypothetical protein